jgi:nucleoid DNA-binding protein
VYRLPNGPPGARALGSAYRKHNPKKKTSPVKQAMTKSQVFGEIADSTGLSRRQVASVFTELGSVIERHIKKQSVGQFTLPGLLKIKTIKKAARKAQKGVPNPFRPGELMDVAAKPATTRVKVLPLKKMKEMAL